MSDYYRPGLTGTCHLCGAQIEMWCLDKGPDDEDAGKHGRYCLRCGKPTCFGCMSDNPNHWVCDKCAE